MCDHILCSKGKIEDFHKLKCIQGESSRCGISTLQLCLHEVDTNNQNMVSWHRFEKVWVARSNDGKDRHTMHLAYKQTPPHVLVTFLKPKLVEFVVHNFEAQMAR
jgi:hypothetical protein